MRKAGEEDRKKHQATETSLTKPQEARRATPGRRLVQRQRVAKMSRSEGEKRMLIRKLLSETITNRGPDPPFLKCSPSRRY